MQAVLAFTEGDMNAANNYIEKYTSIRKDNSVSEAVIATNTANIYWQAAAVIAGYKPILYGGSMEEWSSRLELPMQN